MTHTFRRGLFLASLLGFSRLTGLGQSFPDFKTIALDDLSAFRAAGANWAIGGDAWADPGMAGSLKGKPGTGVALNILKADHNTQLATKEEFRDLELELDFMMAKGSNSGVYLQGRYEVQLLDSWGKLNPAFSDVGGIYQRWDDTRGRDHEGYQGIAPLQNVARAPGLWQHLHICFHAPRFNEKGEKIANAVFSRVYLNGVLVQQEAAVTGPTRSAEFSDEKPTGPLVLQGDHGNVAFRNLRYRSPVDTASVADNTDNPILLSAEAHPYLLRSFVNYGGRKLTHVISAGYPTRANYSYDLKSGALFQLWRGGFLDVTDMWHDRGEPQVAKPLGSVILQSDAPVLAVLADDQTPWPDSAGFDEFRNTGYMLDESRFASFGYEYSGLTVSDKISALPDGSLERSLTVTAAPERLYCRLAVGSLIENSGKGLFTIGDRSYYIRIGEKYKPWIRQTQHGQELLIPVDRNQPSLTYSIIW
ncbi:MAG TPA: DUF1080 domain-containing protein [Puia sp.]